MMKCNFARTLNNLLRRIGQLHHTMSRSYSCETTVTTLKTADDTEQSPTTTTRENSSSRLHFRLEKAREHGKGRESDEKRENMDDFPLDRGWVDRQIRLFDGGASREKGATHVEKWESRWSAGRESARKWETDREWEGSKREWEGLKNDSEKWLAWVMKIDVNACRIKLGRGRGSDLD